MSSIPTASELTAPPRSRARIAWIRGLFIAHRYLGITVGIVMSLWCLSGIVMMYVQYPEMTDRDRLAALTPLQLEACCTLETGALDELPAISEFRLEMLGGVPVLRLTPAFGPPSGPIFDLRTGQPVEAGSPEAVERVARAFHSHAAIGGEPRLDRTLHNDQWTVYRAYHPHRPLHRYAADDEAGTEWYVSGTSGEVVQVTNESVRFWNWIGSVVHWLYPTLLREHTAVWYQLVIWLTVIGLFLTVIGIYIGLRQYRFRRQGRRSPYRGVALWHHYTGLVFGLLVLSWLISGLFSMNPWGLLESSGAGPEQQRLRGEPLASTDVEHFISRFDPAALDRGVVRIKGQAWNGTLAVFAFGSDGSVERLNAQLESRPLTPADWSALPDRLLPDTAVAESGWLEAPDAYYYEHHVPLDFPVWHIVYDNPDRTRYYLDAASGDVVLKADSAHRSYRWLFHALHRGDFSAVARSRPVWDIFMLVLLLGVTASCVTGVWMGYKRLLRKPRR